MANLLKRPVFWLSMVVLAAALVCVLTWTRDRRLTEDDMLPLNSGMTLEEVEARLGPAHHRYLSGDQWHYLYRGKHRKQAPGQKLPPGYVFYFGVVLDEQGRLVAWTEDAEWEPSLLERTQQYIAYKLRRR